MTGSTTSVHHLVFATPKSNVSSRCNTASFSAMNTGIVLISSYVAYCLITDRIYYCLHRVIEIIVTIEPAIVFTVKYIHLLCCIFYYFIIIICCGRLLIYRIILLQYVIYVIAIFNFILLFFFRTLL